MEEFWASVHATEPRSIPSASSSRVESLLFSTSHKYQSNTDQINTADVNLTVTLHRPRARLPDRSLEDRLQYYLRTYVQCMQCQQYSSSLVRSPARKLDLLVCHSCTAMRYVPGGRCGEYRRLMPVRPPQHVLLDTKLRKIP